MDRKQTKLRASSDQVRQLKELIEETGLVEAIKSDLYDDFLKKQDNWHDIRLKLEVLETAEQILRRME